MDFTRRSFLNGALTVDAAMVAPLPVHGDCPVLRGDGIHDDTAALQSMFNAEPAACEGEMIDASTMGRIILRKGPFLISEQIVMRREFTLVRGATFHLAEGFDLRTPPDDIIFWEVDVFSASERHPVTNCDFVLA